MRPLGWVLFVGVLHANVAWADARCADIGLAYLELRPADVRELAQGCKDAALADLYFKRAYHLEFLQRSARHESMVILYGGQRPWLPNYRLYVALIEAMSPHWFADARARIDFLRGEYEHKGEVAELRLRGMDHMADRLERERSSLVR